MNKNHKAFNTLFALLISIALMALTTNASLLTVSISGPTSLDYGETGTYTASASGGTTPYTYAWYYSENSGSTWSGLDLGVSSVSVTAQGTDFMIKCRVIDNILTMAETTISVTAAGPPALSASISGPSSLASGSKGTFRVTPSGGVTPYSYSWSYYIICDDELSKSSDFQITAAPCGYWISHSSTADTANKTCDGRDFRMRCIITDAADQTVTKTKTVASTSSKIAAENNAVEFTLEESENEITETTLGNYPNPFNPVTNIVFTLPEESSVSLKVYDILGREVAQLTNAVHKAGKYTYQFNARNFASGAYIYRLVTKNKIITQKMLLTK